jgi:hypothetical protein
MMGRKARPATRELEETKPHPEETTLREEDAGELNIE